MPGFDGVTLRVWRRSLGWDVPGNGTSAPPAARKAGVHVAAHEGLIRMIYAWERGGHDLSERYELLYRALGLAADQRPGRSAVDVHGAQRDTPTGRAWRRFQPASLMS